MPLYTVKVRPEDKDLFFAKLKEIYPDREVIQSIYLGDTLHVYELELEEDLELTMLKLCIHVKQIPGREDRYEVMEKIGKGLV